MSKWTDVKKEDISLSRDGDEMHFWLESDDDGNVYCSAKVEDIKSILRDKEYQDLLVWIEGQKKEVPDDSRTYEEDYGFNQALSTVQDYIKSKI